MPKLFKLYPTLILGYSVLPLVAGAQSIPAIIEKASAVLQMIISLLFMIATVVFLWGVVRFIASAADPAGREKSKGIMLWGIIGMAVMVAAWGLANLLITYFGPFSSPVRIQPPA